MNRLTVDMADLIVIKDADEVRQYARLLQNVEQRKIVTTVKGSRFPGSKFKRYSAAEDAIILDVYRKFATKMGRIPRFAMRKLSRKLGRDPISLCYRHRVLKGLN